MADQAYREGAFRGFPELLARRAAEQPDRTAFVFLDSRGEPAEELSYGQLERRVRALAAALLGQDLAGKRAILLYPSGADFVVALFACLHAGVVAVPVPYTAGRRTIERLLAIARDARPAVALSDSALLTPREQRAFMAAGVAELRWLFSDRIDTNGDSDPAAMSGDELALLQYTSGSTGMPKGVMLSHRNLIANSAMIAETFGHDEGLRGVGWLPLYHDMGLIGHVLQPVYVGGMSVLMPPLSFLQRPTRWLAAISRWRATTSGGPSQGYELCLRALKQGETEALDLSSWRVAYCGAEPVRADVLRRFAARFADCGFDAGAFHPCYGLAEATLLVTAGKPGIRLAAADRAAADGVTRPLPGCGRSATGGSVAIVDPSRRMRLTDGQVGEICVSGPHVAAGYWGRDVENDDVFHGEVAGESAHFLKTGDLGFLRDGELFVVGRAKAVIIILGRNHAAEDIEATVSAADPHFALLPAAAFAIERDDREWAVVVQEVAPGAAVGDGIARAVENLRSAVARDHDLALADIILVGRGALPRTSSGKIMRARASEMYGAGEFARLNRATSAVGIAPGRVPEDGSVAAA